MFVITRLSIAEVIQTGNDAFSNNKGVLTLACKLEKGRNGLANGTQKQKPVVIRNKNKVDIRLWQKINCKLEHCINHCHAAIIVSILKNSFQKLFHFTKLFINISQAFFLAFWIATLSLAMTIKKHFNSQILSRTLGFLFIKKIYYKGGFVL